VFEKTTPALSPGLKFLSVIKVSALKCNDYFDDRDNTINFAAPNSLTDLTLYRMRADGTILWGKTITHNFTPTLLGYINFNNGNQALAEGPRWQHIHGN
jgi:hypothetical protein